MKRLGILASHRGTNFQAIIDACASGSLAATPVVAISNNSQSTALERARTASIPALHISSKTHPDEDEAICQALVEHQVDLVVTAGYMKKLGPKTLEHFAGRILNVHPSLLPRYGGKGMYGMRVHEAVLANRDLESGLTVHWVDGDYDTGPIIRQQRVPVLPDDTPQTLADRILAEEHLLLVDTLAMILEQKDAS